MKTRLFVLMLLICTIPCLAQQSIYQAHQQPIVQAIAPSSVIVGSPSTDVYIIGKNFEHPEQLDVNCVQDGNGEIPGGIGGPYAVTALNQFVLKITIPAEKLATPTASQCDSPSANLDTCTSVALIVCRHFQNGTLSHDAFGSSYAQFHVLPLPVAGHLNVDTGAALPNGDSILAFGLIPVGSTDTRQAQITNDGGGSDVITISAIETGSPDLAISGVTLPFKLYFGQTVTFNLTWSPIVTPSPEACSPDYYPFHTCVTSSEIEIISDSDNSPVVIGVSKWLTE